MKKLRLIVLNTTVIAWLAFSANAAPSQQPRTESPTTNLALEVTCYKDRPPSYLSVPKHGSKPGGAWYTLFRRVPSWEPPAGSLPVRAVNILAHLEGDSVRIAVSVFLGVRLHEKEEAVTTRLVHENGKVIISELTQFGVEPFEIKVVRVAHSLATHPQVTSQAGSIAVVGIEAKDSTLPSYKVSLQNLSSQNVIALGVEVLVNGQKRLSSMPHEKEGQPLIMAGAVYELSAFGARDALLTSEGYRPDSPQGQEIVISVAVFEDNSYEGDAETAARFRALMIGRKIQIARLLPLIQTASDSTELNVSAALNRLKAQVSSLSNDVEMSVADQLLKDFPTLSPSVKERLKPGIEVALHGVKTGLLKDIQEFEKLGSQSLDAQAFQTWLRVKKERYEKWLSRL